MSRWRVYVKPFDVAGEYVADYTEITHDVQSIGDPKQGIDNTDFDVGVIKNSGFTITLRNDHGYYSDVLELKSIFRYTRKNSLIKITWDIRDYDLICGFFQIGDEPLGGEYVVFEGLINEVTTTNNISEQKATFSVLGFEALLDEIEVPYSSLSNGDTFEQILYDCLNQAPFTDHVTVDATNLSLATDLAADNISSFENKTVGGILKSLLLAANSVLYVKDGTAYASARDASDATQFTFYGQASQSIENIVNIPKFRDGMNRVFNLWTWNDDVPAVDARDATSITKYGIRRKQISLDLISDGSTSKIQSILDANRDEFAFPKMELELETPIWYDTLALQILDKVNIDYPTVFIPYDDGILPRYGLDIYNEENTRYPYEQWSLTLATSTFFKIMSKKLNVQKQTITFGLREV